MKEIKDCVGKLICLADPKMKQVEIVHKRTITIVRFLPNNQVEVRSSEYIKTA